MSYGFPESDWKVFRELRETALQRFCKRILDEVVRIRDDQSRSYHERYLALCGWLGDRDQEMAEAFNNPRRSQMLWQLASIITLELLEVDELSRFSSTTREKVELFTKSV
jgi:hypothetical protein